MPDRAIWQIGTVLFGLGLAASGPALALGLELSAPELSAAERDSLRAQTLLSDLAGRDIGEGQQVLAAAQADYARLVSALYEMGRFAPVVRILLDGREAAGIAPVAPPAQVGQVRIEVRPGPVFRFGRAQVGPLAEGTEIPEGFRSGQVAAVGTLRDAAGAAVDGWRAQGHALARIDAQQITARHEAAQLDATLRVAPGPELTYGPLTVTGETAVRPERIRAIAGLRQGTSYAPDQVEDAEERLRRTGTFRAVRLVEATEATQTLQLPIEVQVTDMKPRRFGFGAELFSRQGLTLSGYWLHRNLLGGAERLRFDTEISGIGGEDGGIDGRIALRLDRPATFHARADFHALAEIEVLDEVAFYTERVALEAGLSYRADRRRTFSAAVGLVAAHSRDAFGSREYRLLTFPFTAQYEGRDNPLNPLGGWFGRAELTPFLGAGDVDSGARAFLDLRGYRALDPGGRIVLAGRAQLGSVIGPAPDRSPSEMLFYSGGSGTVRGHGFQSLGVTLPSGDVIGGRSFAGLSAEVRLRTSDRLSVVGFVDYGVVGSDSLPGSAAQDHSGVGIGLRYETGIGPIRLDLAGPLTGQGDGLQVYIGIGQAF